MRGPQLDVNYFNSSSAMAHNATECVSHSGTRFIFIPVAGKLYDLCEEDLQCMYQIPFSRCQIAPAPRGEIVGNCTCANGYHQIGYVSLQTSYFYSVFILFLNKSTCVQHQHRFRMIASSPNESPTFGAGCGVFIGNPHCVEL